VTILVVAVVVIAAVTLSPAPYSYRAHSLRVAFDLSPVHLREDGLNALLFVPLGVGAAAAGLTWWKALLLSTTLSLTVEALQLTVVPGRFAEVQDIVANVAGAAIGWWISRLLLARSAPRLSDNPPRA